jgi:hypothetical protein
VIRGAIVLLAALAAGLASTAGAQGPATCAPGKAASVTLQTDDKGRTAIVATHQIEVTADIHAADPRNVQIVPQAGVDVLKKSSGGEVVDLFAPTTPVLGLTVNWTQSADESNPEETARCSANQGFTLPVLAANPARGVKQPNPGPDNGDYTFAIAAAEAKRADFRPLEVRITSTAKRRLPKANERLRTWVVPMRDAEQVNYHKRLPNLAYATTAQKCRFWWPTCGPAFAELASLNVNDRALNRGLVLPDLSGSNSILRSLAYTQPSRWASPYGIVIDGRPGAHRPNSFGWQVEVRQGGRLLARVGRAGRCRTEHRSYGLFDHCTLSRSKTLLG